MNRERLTKQAAALGMRNERQRSWWARVKDMLNRSSSSGNLGVFLNMEDLERYMLDVEFDVDKRECDDLKEHVSSMSTLENYHHIKCWEIISKERAYAKTHIGRQAPRFLEPYLVEWPNDKRGTRLKILARSGQLLLNGMQAQRSRAMGALSMCLCCNSDSEETFHHFLMECPAYHHLRNRRDQRVHRALSAAQRGVEPGLVMNSGEFDSLSSYDRMLRILGKRMDFVKTEEAIDRACRKYLVRAWEERKVIHEQWANSEWN